MNYKFAYRTAMMVIWILVAVLAFHTWHTSKVLTKLEGDINDFHTQEITQMYIDAGWMPPHEKIKPNK